MNYENMPSHSRVWIYQASRQLAKNEEEAISNAANQFIAQWAAHGQPLKASFDIIYERFLVLMVDEAQALASGCSIDSSVHFFQEIEKAYQIDLFDRMQIAYKENDSILTLPLSKFQSALEKEEINENTIVFNNLVKTQVEFLEAWEVPLKKSWHKQLV